ncbi:MAG: hypothetical protein QG649_794 [Patescibacteria group bacterium]|nr:hypothetical protein [Patescibacteria group bacterium]
MEPKFSSPELNTPESARSPESLPSYPTPESNPEIPLPAPERGQHASPERAAEQSAQAQAAIAAQPGAATLPTPIPVPDDTAQGTVADDLPSVAADDDLIEKEWVDKAKQIISQTHDDPAAREKQVGRLQADYLKKRYGKSLGTSTE